MKGQNRKENLGRLLLALFLLTPALASAEEPLRSEINNTRAACWKNDVHQPKLELLSGDEPRMCVRSKESELRPVNEILEELQSNGREDRMHNS